MFTTRNLFEADAVMSLATKSWLHVLFLAVLRYGSSAFDPRLEDLGNA